MSATIKNVLLIGGTGNVGSLMLKALHNTRTFDVTVLSRLSSTATFPPSVKVIKNDFSESALVSAFRGQDAVVSNIGAAAFLDQKKMIDAAIEAGVKRFIPSEFSVDSMSPTVRDLLPLFEQKKEILEYLKTKEGKGMTWTGIATGPFFDWGLQVGILGFDLKSESVTLWDGGKTLFPASTVEATARALIATLQNPEKTANKYLHIASFITTQNEILEAIERVTGKKWAVTQTTGAAQIKTGRDLVAKGDFSGNFPLIMAAVLAEVEGRDMYHTKEENLDNKLLGLPVESFDNILEGVCKTSEQQK